PRTLKPDERRSPYAELPLDAIHTWLEQSGQGSESERREAADRINQKLSAVPAGSRARATADFLLAQLDAKAFGALVDSNNFSCRAAAVEALLSLGYPFALEVNPEDLEHLRA